MEIKTDDKYCIIMPLSPKLGKREGLRLLDEINSNSSLKIGLDLSYVNDWTIDFIDIIKNIKNISLYNIPSDLFVFINSMSLDKIFNIYVSEIDFTEDAHRILNRKFSIVK